MTVKLRRSFLPLPQFGSWHLTRSQALTNPSTQVEEGDAARTQTTLWENSAADARYRRHLPCRWKDVVRGGRFPLRLTMPA
jgi:hypothetical protein